jgi:hypothetical protein
LTYSESGMMSSRVSERFVAVLSIAFLRQLDRGRARP